MPDFTIQPIEKPAQCQAHFHGAGGQCTRPAEFTVLTRWDEASDLCSECVAPYQRQITPDPTQQGLGI